MAQKITGASRVLVGEPGGNGLLGKLRGRWEDNIKTDLKEIGWDVVDWIDIVQDRDRWWDLVNVVMNLQFT